MPRNRKAQMRGNSRRMGSFKPQGGMDAIRPDGQNQTYEGSQPGMPRTKVPTMSNIVDNSPRSEAPAPPVATAVDYKQGDLGGSSYNRKFSRCVMDSIRGGESYLNAKKKCNG